MAATEMFVRSTYEIRTARPQRTTIGRQAAARISSRGSGVGRSSPTANRRGSDFTEGLRISRGGGTPNDGARSAAVQYRRTKHARIHFLDRHPGTSEGGVEHHGGRRALAEL